MSLIGIDVYGGDDSGLVAAAFKNASFVIAKAAEGNLPDKRHAYLASQARAAGKLVGHYYWPWMSHDPVDSAKNLFLHVANPLVGETLWLDFEPSLDQHGNPIPEQWLTSWPERIAWSLTFMGTVSTLSHAHCGWYTNKSMWGQIGAHSTLAQKAVIAHTPLWIAAPSDPAGKPGIASPWVLHQYGERGGIDADYFNGDAAAWHALGVPAPKPVVVTPPKPVVPPKPAPAPQPTPAPVTPAPVQNPVQPPAPSPKPPVPADGGTTPKPEPAPADTPQLEVVITASAWDRFWAWVRRVLHIGQH